MQVISKVKWPKDFPEPSEEQVVSMMDSIKSIGRLLHPITVRSDSTLVTGGVRLRACQRLGWEAIPCEIIPADTTPEECKVIRIHENLKRANLPWQDQVVMEKELHDLRQKEHGVGRRGKKVGWSLRDTAEELEISFGTLSEDIRLAEAVLADPTLRKVGDKATAKRVVFYALKRTQQEFSAGLPVEFGTDVVHLGSSEVVLRAYPENAFDACITDPPWSEYKDKALTMDEFTFDVFRQVFRVLKPNSFLYVFASVDDFLFYRTELPKLGFRVQQHPNVWVKLGVLTHGTRTWEYQRDYEVILVAVKGSPALSGSMLSAVLSFPVVHPSKLIHPNEKPIGLIKALMEHCTYPGAVVLDPFAGSGVVAEAAMGLGRRFVVIERDPTFHAKILGVLEILGRKLQEGEDE